MADNKKQQQDQEAYRKLYEEAMKKQQEIVAEASRAQIRAQERQKAIDEMPRRKYAVIAAVDLLGGLSKDGQIPWHYKQDFQWFKERTMNQICIMGRGTYEDINKRLGEKAAQSVLPGRKCFVVSNTLDPAMVTNATVIRGVFDIETHLTTEDDAKTAFIIGGDAIFREGISMASEAYITTINKEFSCDKFFPTDYLMKFFAVNQVFKTEDSPDLRFVIFKRNVGKFI